VQSFYWSRYISGYTLSAREICRNYALGLVIFGVLLALLYRTLKLSSFDRCAKMSGKQFEEEANALHQWVVLCVQKLLGPSHRVEYVQQTEEHPEDRTNSDDKPSC